MKSLSNAADAEQVLARVQRITPDAQRLWGTMTVGEMVCHLTDSFRGPLKEKDLGRIDTIFSRTVMQFIGLWVPMPWPKGLRTMPEMNPKKKGTRPTEFERDRAELVAVTHRFIAASPVPGAHPLFGEMTRNAWNRWGWLHLDHHLRQFGL